jgi:hypothetical protein
MMMLTSKLLREQYVSKYTPSRCGLSTPPEGVKVAFVLPARVHSSAAMLCITNLTLAAYSALEL